MNKIINWIWSNLDKVCYVAVCIIIAIVFGAIIFNTTNDCTVVEGAACGFFAGVIVGALKEVFDFCRGGKFDAKDLFADVIGSIIGALLMVLIF